MRNLQFTFFLFCGIIFLKTESVFGQNLQFNQAIFNTYGPGNADGNVGTPMFTGSLVVGVNQIIKITHANCSSVNPLVSGTLVQPQNGILTINGLIMHINGLTELWLPTGTYSIVGHEMSSVYNGGAYKGMISGILYDIVP
jgi:hypothetical protein